MDESRPIAWSIELYVSLCVHVASDRDQNRIEVMDGRENKHEIMYCESMCESFFFFYARDSFVLIIDSIWQLFCNLKIFSLFYFRLVIFILFPKVTMK